MEDHTRLIDYLKGVSAALGKKVILTPQNERETVLILIEAEKVTFPENK